MKIKTFSLLICCFFASIALAQGEQGKGYIPLDPAKRKALYAESVRKHGGRIKMMSVNQEIPPKFDTRDKGWVIPTGDQKSCGSCYLYSTIYGTLTQAFVKAGYGKNDGSLLMSVQFGMDCHNFGGCNGGNGTEVIDWVVRNGWVAEKWVDVDGKAHTDYPSYEARTRACREASGTKRWKIAEWGFVSTSPNRAPTTLEIKTALVNYGPLNVSVDAGGQFGNGTGTITSLGRSIDHEIELIAYDDAKDGGAFLLKNQWGNGWGTGGVRWVTYKAAANLVDIFFVSVAPLPPPPPIPDPGPPIPDPPIGGLAIVFPQAVPAGTYYLTPKAKHEEIRAKIAALQKLLDEINDGKMEVTPVPEVKQPPKKLPEGPKEEKPPESKAKPKESPKIIDGALQADRDAVAGLQAKVKDVERSRNVVVSVSHEFDVAAASAEELRREREWLTRRLEAMSKP